MKIIAINGYKGFIATNYFKKYNKVQKIIHYKKNINNITEFKKFIKKINQPILCTSQVCLSEMY